MVSYSIINIYFFIMFVAVIHYASVIKTLSRVNYTNATSLLGLVICVYMFGYMMELNSNTREQIIFWNTFEYLGIPFVSALWLTVGLMYTGYFSRYKRFLYTAIYLIPVVSVVLRFTNSYHYLYFSSVNFAWINSRLFLDKIHGPWMFVQAIHSMLMIFASLGIFLYDYIDKKEKNTFKIVMIVSASVAASLGLTLTFVKPFGLILDYMALLLPLSCLTVIIAIAKYDFLETKVLARSTAFELNRDALLILNRQGKIIDYNPCAKTFLKYVKKNRNSFLNLYRKYCDAEDRVIKLKVGEEVRYYEVTTKSIDGALPSNACIMIVHDATKAHELNESLKRQALMDYLSGLHNRRAFMQIGREIVQNAEKAGESIHLLMLDMDMFKTVNDRFGHQMGDTVIKSLGALLKSFFSEKTLVARLGGEEFGIILRGYDDSQVHKITDELLKKIENHKYNFKGEKFTISASVGVAKKIKPDESLDELMRIADKALYQSKDRGRNCYTFIS
ncbi:MAG: diguanylate cyclase [Firmicutes bacterium]|nr:diguanylate cyclase [Bacillota bacterium]